MNKTDYLGRTQVDIHGEIKSVTVDNETRMETITYADGAVTRVIHAGADWKNGLPQGLAGCSCGSPECTGVRYTG